MLITRPFWQKLIEDAWQQKNIVWLMGARRVGKTSLCQSLADIEYFDCELPRFRQLFTDPEGFLESKKGKRLILDEIHRLNNPSELLKIASDHYPDVKIIATGSSTLGASRKFKDTLTGRKREIWLTPMLLQEMDIFGNLDLRHRFLFGGFPSFFTSKQLPETAFQEWVDAYWAKDIQDIFSVGKRSSFQKFTELLFVNSGGMFEATKYTTPCEITRGTIANYLNTLEETFIVHVIRPFSMHKNTEIVSAPKVYGFDTGFVCHAKGRGELRPEDLGLMWEQCILNEIHAHLQKRTINYWRDKQGHEIDFVMHNKNTNEFTAIECKFTISSLCKGKTIDTSLRRNIEAFRRLYPDGKNYVVASDISQAFERRDEDMVISFVSPKNLLEAID